MSIVSGPIGQVTLSDIPGHVDAFGECVLADLSTVNRDYVEVGLQENHDPADPWPLMLVGSTDLEELAGAADGTPTSGAYASSTVVATITTTPVAVCSTGSQPHIGAWKVGTRFYATEDTTYIRLSWRVGEGPWTSERWKPVPAEDGWFEVNLGVIEIAELPSGHSWEGRIEAYDSEGTATLEVDFVDLMPRPGCGVSTAPEPGTPTVFAARTGFNTESGAINTDTLDGGGTWTTAGTGTDLAAAAGVLTRTTTDASLRWAYPSGVASTATNTGVAVDLKMTTNGGPGRVGVFARYVDTNNYAFAGFSISGGWMVQVVVAGNATNIAQAPVLTAVPVNTYFRPEFIVFSNGSWLFYIDGILTASGWRAELAPSGTLNDGRAGILDENSGTANTRTYDNFAAWIPEVDHAIWSGREATLDHDSYERENSDASEVGQLPIVGKYLTIPPSTRADLEHRLVTKTRRYAIDEGLPSDGLSDSLDLTVTATPRVVLTS